MSNLSKAEAQLRADQIRAFREELERLESANVLGLSAAQRQAVTRHHDGLLASYAQSFDIDRDRHAKQLSLGMRIASFLGALALAASVFFLFNQYWGLLQTTVQVVLLIVASSGSLLATFWVGRRDSSGYFAKLVAMVAFACFVLNVALLGGMFNITPSDKAFVVWGAFALLLAYTFDLRLLLGAGIACLVAFVAARAGTWSGMYWLDFGERPENFFPAALLLLLVPHLIRHERFAGFAGIYRVFGLLTLLLPVLVLANWGRSSYLPLAGSTVEHLYQVLGFGLSAAAIWWGARREHPGAVNTGTTFFVIFLYTKFYDWWWEIVPKFVFFLIIALTAILFILVMKRLRAGARVVGGAQ
ncbi:MAG: DUF2157 domain-containing protein [Pseudomonadota bacterium]|nr:DUF2157 domain-containing protein [Pseudomonadota bacterium]